MTSRVGIALCLACGAASVACSSANRGPAGGPVSGPLDTHCTLPDGGTVDQVTSQAACAAAPGFDAGTVDYGETLYNAEGDDDDCKYHVKFSATPIYRDSDVTFTVLATNRAGGGPTTGADVQPEIYLSTTHPAPNTPLRTTESPPGTYQIGPVQFDAPGRWTVRFHFYENCVDAVAESPHGHAAFYIDVP